MFTSGHARAAALAAAAPLTLMAVMQIYWGLGGTWALEDASGGTMENLSAAEQVASLVLGVIVFGAAVLLLDAAGFLNLRLPEKAVGIAAWLITGAFAFGALVNFSAKTDFERLVSAPIALVVALLALVVANTHRRAPPARPISH